MEILLQPLPFVIINFALLRYSLGFVSGAIGGMYRQTVTRI